MAIESLGILAGGLGLRAREIANDSHKSLLRLPDGLTIIERLIEQAKLNNIKKTYVVSDPKISPEVFDEVKRIGERRNMEVVTIAQNVSKFYGTMFALALICSVVPEGEDVVVFEGDVVVSDSAARMIYEVGADMFVLDDVLKHDNESMKAVVNEDGIVTFDKSKTGYSEFCGIMCLGFEMRQKYLLESKKVRMKKPYYEDVFNNMAMHGVELPYLMISESEWNEVDDKDDFDDVARKINFWK